MVHGSKVPQGRLAFLALACLTFGVSGCLPGVAWLPDSSGFVYIADHKGNITKLMRYDLATKRKQVLAEQIPETVQPGLSPDGKRIAVAKYNNPKGQPSTLQVIIIYDDQGKVRKTSKEFDWKTPDPENILTVNRPPALYWAPDGGQIIVYCDSTTALFDVKTFTMKVFADTIIVNIAGSPIRPDKRGFLVLKSKKVPGKMGKESEYAFVNWQGKVQELKWADGAMPDLKGAQNSPNDVFLLTMFIVSPLHESRWENDVAVLTFSGTTIRIDTGKREVAFKYGEPVIVDGSILHSRYSLGQDVEVRILVVLPEKGAKPTSLLPDVRVELVMRNQKPKVLVSVAGMLTVTPSPNGEWLALRCWLPKQGPGPGEERLLLVNRRGEVIEVGAMGK